MWLCNAHAVLETLFGAFAGCDAKQVVKGVTLDGVLCLDRWSLEGQ